MNQAEAIVEGMSAQSVKVRTLYDDNVFEKLATVSASTLMLEYYERNETTKYRHGHPMI